MNPLTIKSNQTFKDYLRYGHFRDDPSHGWSGQSLDSQLMTTYLFLKE